jgi:Carboxypeptidase regulatory-like domain
MKSSYFSLRSFAAALLVFAFTFAGVVTGIRLAPVQAQQRSTAQRIVQGKVTDKSDAPLKGVIVYLKDTHSLAVKSNITDEAGAYRFGQLAQNTDYEIWAEISGKKSGTKTISSFDSKNQFYINLKIDTDK